jgi:hypothetical protein
MGVTPRRRNVWLTPDPPLLRPLGEASPPWQGGATHQRRERAGLPEAAKRWGWLAGWWLFYSARAMPAMVGLFLVYSKRSHQVPFWLV